MVNFTGSSSIRSDLEKTRTLILSSISTQDVMQWAKEATEGKTDAMFKLAVYCQTLGGEKENKAAFGLLKKAAKKGNNDALLLLSNCYELGIGVSINPIKAKKLFDRGINNLSKFNDNEFFEIYFLKKL